MVASKNWAGRQVGGRYDILYCIGRTGMSSVYEAHDTRDNCQVVVKITRDSPKHPNLTTYLKNEADALGRFNHPNIVRLIDSGEVEDWYFIVLELIRGPVIVNCFSRTRPLPVDCGVFVMTEVLAALEHAHQMGVVHCDLKPENVMSTDQGVIKLLDFALARPIYPTNESRQFRLASGSLAGTPPYLSPEQLSFIDLDCRSDIYSCGVFLYFMLTGGFPFPMRKFVNKKKGMVRYWKAPRRPFPDVPFVPYSVQDVVYKALQSDPDDRYQSVKEMHLALLDAIAPQSVEDILLSSWDKIVGEVTQPLRVLQP